MADVSNERTVKLNNGIEMPLLGLGTWQVEGRAAFSSVASALSIGYRHLDTATAYGNEQEVGAAVRESGIERDDLFITTKLPPNLAGREAETIDTSLAALGVQSVDLWLVHWPPNGSVGPATWSELVKANKEGKARAIGVSNYSTRQIDELIDATGVVPAVNQIPWSPSQYDAARAAELAERGVVLEGYSPLQGSDLAHPVLADVARAHSVTPAQIVLRWHLQHGVVVIPKSVHEARLRENFDLFAFTLDDEELARIDGLSEVRAAK